MDLIGYIVIGLISLVTIVYYYYKISFQYWKSRNIPFVEPSFPYGNIKGLGSKVHPAIVMQKIYNKLKGSDKFCGVYFFTSPVALLLDLDLIKSVLVKDFNYFNDRGLYYNEVDDPLSAHLFAVNNENNQWKNLRTKLTPTFTSGKMKFMFTTVVSVGKRFRDCLHEIVKEREVVEIRELLARFTTDVIGTCAFGIECNSLNDPNAEFLRMGRAVFGNPRYSQAIRAVHAQFKNISKMLGIKVLQDEIALFFTTVIRETIEFREKNNVHRNDFMDLLIKLKNGENDEKLSFNEVAAQVFVFFVAGFDTSSTTLSFCLYELALNQDVQAKARTEIRNVLSKYDGKLTYEAMMDMKYLENVIKETLRKFPPVPNLTRGTQNDYHVPETNHIIKKNTVVTIPTFAIHHNKEYYPNPEKFDPDRFTPEEVQKRDSMAYLPFGEGPRNCIGARFGMMQVKIGLIELLNGFEFSTCERTKVPLPISPVSFILVPDGEVHLKVKQIKLT